MLSVFRVLGGGMNFFFLRKWRNNRAKWRAPYATWQTEQRAVRAVFWASIYIFGIVIIHTFAMIKIEGLSLEDSLWLTLTTITTVGYGDISASTGLGRISTAVIVYLGGIFVLAKIAGDFFDYSSRRREAMKNGNWSWRKMRDHIIIIGSEVDSTPHLRRLISEFKREHSTTARGIVLVSESYVNGLPAALQGFDVRYVNGHGNLPGILEQAAVSKAFIVVMLAWREEEQLSDSLAFDVISRVRDVNSEAQIIAECVDDNNRKRLEKAGATLVLRPVRAYPEMIIGGLLNPGSTAILENLFTAEGERIATEERDQQGLWKDIVLEYLQANSGTPIAYRDADTGDIVTAPAGSKNISADAIFLLGT